MRKTFKLFGRYIDISISVYSYSNQFLNDPNPENKAIVEYYTREELKILEKYVNKFTQFSKICDDNQAEIVKWKKTPEPLSGELGEIPSFKILNSTKFIPNPKTGKPYTDKEYEEATNGTYLPVEEELKGKWKL